MHQHPHAFRMMNPHEREGLVVASRRNVLKASLAGLCGLSLPELLRQQARARPSGGAGDRKKSVILLWMTGGPSHIDTWDPKPDRPLQNRGPFGVIQTKLPGVVVCEHLPKMAAMLDRCTIIRSVDARHSNHEPNKVFQTGHLDAAPRIDPSTEMTPAIGSVIARHRGGSESGMPPYVAFQRSKSHVAHGGYLGRQYDPFIANQASQLPIFTDVGAETGRKSQAQFFKLPGGLTHERLRSRQTLLEDIDRLRGRIDRSPAIDVMDQYSQAAVELLVGRRAHETFDLSREPARIRDRYGKHLWCQQALLARRMVEAGVSFVTIDLSYHPSSGTWDTHGDNIPPYGGISKGLKPLLPLFDHLFTTLVGDLEERGLIDDVLVIAMGEFGRTPLIGTQESTDGRNHWAVVMSMALAGGGFRHGQVIGATEADGGYIKERPVTPGDLAATIYHHMGVPLEGSYTDGSGRPRFIVEHGKPIGELI